MRLPWEYLGAFGHKDALQRRGGAWGLRDGGKDSKGSMQGCDRREEGRAEGAHREGDRKSVV